jgi:hypothetical protein
MEIGGPPEGKARVRTTVFIAVFAAIQVLLPLRYYFAEDVYDERFSWRMFSGVRMQDCTVEVVETVGGSPRQVELDQVLHVSWQTTLKRNREGPIWKFLERRCEEEGVERVTMSSFCARASGDALPVKERTRICASGEENEREVPR